MCLCWLQLPGSGILPADYFKNSHNGNPHGGGYMFVADGAVVVKKPFWDWKRLYQHYCEDYKKYGEKSHFGVHFRLATHGGINSPNCHPHEIRPGKSALIHNGIIRFNRLPSNMSDSAAFAKYLSRYPDDFLTKTTEADLQELIGDWNKVAILDANNNILIVNERVGHWSDGVWYSGTGYMDRWWDWKDGKYVVG